MPLPQAVGRFNRLVTNRLMRLVAGRIPPLAIVEQTGRRSGRRYRTPIMAFRSGDGYLIALTYGAATDWVRNVLASGSATIEQRGQRMQLTDPQLMHESKPPSELPRIVRIALGLLHVTEYLRLRSEKGT